MKKLITLALGLISYFGSAASCVWAVVEFILYLVKDKEFNWWSVWMILICGVIAIVFLFIAAITEAKEEIEASKLAPKKSKFQEKLEKMAEERKSQLKN